MRRYTYILPAEVNRVLDGDTVEVHLGIYPAVELHGVRVRVEGINAPELHDAGGADSKRYAESLLQSGTPVEVISSHADKYGRLLGRIRLPDGRDFSDLMLAAGQAVPYTP